MENKNMCRISATVLMLMVCVGITATAQTLGKKNIKKTEPVLPLDPSVRSGKLANGFTYFIRHNQEPKKRVYMYLVNNVGSVLEDEDQRGLAHFMEHMSFNGTVHFPHNELVDYLQKAGVRFGADINAYTSFDETVYQLPLPSDKPEILKEGLEIMHDWTQFATLDPGEIDKERGVVLEEKRLGKGAGERMRRQYWPVLLNNSRYSLRVPIGLDTVLDNFKRPQIARFYHDWYRPDLQALIIVGDMNADSMERVVKAKFSDLKNPLHERPRIRYAVPLDSKNQFIAVTDKEMTSTQAEVFIKHAEQPLHTAADYYTEVEKNLFNQMMGERYAELSRKADPPFISGGVQLEDFLGNLDAFEAFVNAKPGELERGYKALWKEVVRLKRFGFTQTELDRAKAAYLSRIEASWKEKEKTNSILLVQQYQEYFLKGTAAPGIDKIYELAKQHLPFISLKGMDSLATANISSINRAIVVLAPEKDKANLPDEAKVNSWISEVENEKLEPYKDEVSSKPLLTKNPGAGKIVASQHDQNLNTTTWTLSNGVKVILKPTTFKDDQVVFDSFADGGTSLATDANYQSALNAANVISAAGAGNYNATELSKYLSGKQLRVKSYITARSQGFIGSSTPKDLETALALVYAYTVEPRKNDTLFKAFISQAKAALANRADDPKSVFNDTVSAVLGNHNVRRTGPSIEKLNQINLDNAYDFYKESFADASAMTFTFVGAIDTVTLKPLLEKYLGSLPASNKHIAAKDLGIHVPEGKIERLVYKGNEPQSTVVLVYSGVLAYSQQNIIELDALKETLQIRLLQRLREDESGVYSPGVFVNTSKLPESRYSFVIQFGCGPQNVEKLISSAKDEVRKLREDGPLQENVDKWRAEDKVSRETALSTNEFWLNYLTNQSEDDNDMHQVVDYPNLRDQVTPASLQSMAKKYLSGDNFIKLILLPENVKPAQ